MQSSGRRHHENAFSFDSDRIIDHQIALAQVSILLLLGPRTRIRGYCLRMVCNHSSNFSQTKKNDAETGRSRTQARPYARPLLHMSYHPTAHYLTVSPHSIMSMPEKSPSFPPISSASPPLSHSTHRVMLRCMRSRQTHGDRDRRGCAVISVQHFVYVYVCTWDRTLPQHAYIHFLPPQFYLHAQLCLPLEFFHASRVYSKTQLCRNLSSLVRQWEVLNVLSALLLS